MPTVFWDARQLLDCYPLVGKFKCTGTTVRGARCGQTFIDRKSESDNILSILSSKNIVVYGLDNDMQARLRTLVEFTLCPRWHRSRQVDAVYLKWLGTIGGYIAEERGRIEIQREQIQRSPRVLRPVRAVAATPVRLDRPIQIPGSARDGYPIQLQNGGRRSRPRNIQEAPDPPAGENLDEIQRSLEELELQINMRAAARERLNEWDRQINQRQADIERAVRLPAPQADRPQRIPPLPQPPAVVENNATIRQERALRRERSIDRIVNAPAVQVPQPAPPPPLRQVVQRAPARVSPYIHRPRVFVERKPLDEECYICYEPFDGPEDAVWCRSTCGQNLHKECFAEWSRTQDVWNIWCGYCRARWV